MCVDEPSVFKASDNSMREEVRGAEEVPEDENTAVELPVDQVLLSFSVISFPHQSSHFNSFPTTKMFVISESTRNCEG